MRWFNAKDAEEYRDRIEEMAEERQMQNALYGQSARQQDEDCPSWYPETVSELARLDGHAIP